MKTLNMIHAAKVVGGDGPHDDDHNQDKDISASTMSMLSNVMSASDANVATLDVIVFSLKNKETHS